MAPVTNPHSGGNNPHDHPENYVGLLVEEAERLAAERGWSMVRTLPLDAVVTMEYVAGRLNLGIENGRVVRCWPG
ncbi:MAG: hypothetical protein JO362_09170 [Streptomycetaceae bacterium]|nr:hypothetical protein [Streptomycetaceae bacterium]